MYSWGAKITAGTATRHVNIFSFLAMYFVFTTLESTTNFTTMPTHSQHDSPMKNRFIGAVQAGLTITAAAKENDIPRHTASDIWHKYQTTGLTHNLP
jgi:hypothetical protein